MKRLLVSQSEVNTFRACRMKHHILYTLGWKPKRATEAQNRGTIGHKALECMYRAIRDGHVTERSDLILHAMRGATDWIAAAQKNGLELEENLFEQTTDAITRYVDRFALSDVQSARVFGIEQSYAVPLRNETGSAAQHVWHISKVDLELAFDEDLVIVEHKFTSDDATKFDARFDVDPQTPGYLYDLRQHNPTLKLRLGRVILNVIRKKGPSTPKVNKVTKGDCSTVDLATNKKQLMQGKWELLSGLEAESGANQGLVSVAQCDTTRLKYRLALEEQLKRGHAITDEQNAFCDSLPNNEDRYICRHEHYYTEKEVLRWQLDMHADARLIRMVQDGRLRASRNGGHCFPQNAFGCEAREMCVNEMNEPADPENWDQLDQSSEARLKRLRENG